MGIEIKILQKKFLFFWIQGITLNGKTLETKSKSNFWRLWITLIWRAHCRDVIACQWESKLKKKEEAMSSLNLLDISSLSILQPAKVWSMAGLDSTEVRKVAVGNWMTLGVYKHSIK